MYEQERQTREDIIKAYMETGVFDMQYFHGIRSDIINSMLLVANSSHEKAKYVVSVGSGSGLFELYLESVLEIKVYCIDPKIECYGYNGSDEIYYKEPDYPTVEEFLKDHPDAVSNSTLFLGWPCPNNSKYDYESIGLLDPVNIVIAYASCGAAGSKYLLRWLYDSFDRDDIDEYVDEEGKPKNGTLDDWFNSPHEDHDLGHIGYSWNEKETSYYISRFPTNYNYICSFDLNKELGVALRALFLSKYNVEDFDQKLYERMEEISKRTHDEEDENDYMSEYNKMACAIC